VGNQLETNAMFDFETKSSYTIRVRTTDSGTPAQSFEKAFTITVLDVNEPPTSITLSPATVQENLPPGTTVGSLSATDPDAGASATFTLVSTVDCPGADNASFQLTGNTLTTNKSFDFETKPVYSICVRATDNGTPALTFDENLTVTVLDANDQPTDIQLSNAKVAENLAAGAPVGTFSSTDQDVPTQTFTYTLVSGTGSDDNASFQIV